jgi:hypothetical protein
MVENVDTGGNTAKGIAACQDGIYILRFTGADFLFYPQKSDFACPVKRVKYPM